MCELWSVDSYGLGSSHLFVGHIPRSLHMSLWLFVIQYPECCWWYTLTPQKSPCYCGVSHSSTATSCWCVEPQNHTDLTTVFFTQQITTIYKIMCICIHILHTLSTTINYIYYIYIWLLIKNLLSGNGHSSRIKMFFSRKTFANSMFIFRGTYVTQSWYPTFAKLSRKKKCYFRELEKKKLLRGFPT